MNCSKFEEGGSDERMDATHMSVSLRLESLSWKALVFSTARYAFNLFFTRETVWYSGYMIWQIFS